MELHTYVAQIRTQLEAAASLGDDRAREIAAALSAAAEPAVQLALVAALSAGADEITAALLDAPGAPAVMVRFADDRVQFDVRHYEVESSPPAVDDGDASARISLRLAGGTQDRHRGGRQERLGVGEHLAGARGGICAVVIRRRSVTGRTRAAAAAGTQRISGWING